MSSDPMEWLRNVPRLRLAQLPTPLHELTKLRRALGENSPRIFVKRDDLTGLALGGNKARKLEYILADASERGADTVITCGAAQSNHALQTAAACREFGFDVRCILYGSAPGSAAEPTGNLLLHSMLDTPIRWVKMEPGETRREQALRRGMRDEANAAQADGKTVYSIPTGGSTAIGALGYVEAITELRSQLTGAEADSVRALYFASGSGGTQAGMVVGARLSGWPVRCVGVEVEPIPAGADGASPFHRAVTALTRETATTGQLKVSIEPNSVELDPRFAGPAYGVETEAGRTAARLLFRTEGILLDPIYTAKAFAAVLDAVHRNEFRSDETIVFWHTGGAAGLFARH